MKNDFEDFEDIISLITRLKIKLPRGVLEKIICGGFNVLKETKYMPELNGCGFTFSMSAKIYKTLKTIMENSGIKPTKGNTLDQILAYEIREMLVDIGMGIYRHFSRENEWKTTWSNIYFKAPGMSLREQSGFKDDDPKRFFLTFYPMTKSDKEEYIFEAIKKRLTKNCLKQDVKKNVEKFKNKKALNLELTKLRDKGILDKNFDPLYSQNKLDKFLRIDPDDIQLLSCASCKEKFPASSGHQINLHEKGLPAYCPSPKCCKQKAHNRKKKIKNDSLTQKRSHFIE